MFFKPTRTLRLILVSPKDKTEKKDITGLVYYTPCQGQTSRGQCKETYIGETERTLKTRFLEHRRPSTTASEVSNHIHVESSGHFVDLDNVQILDRDSRWFERGVKEAVHIKANKPSLNKDGAGTNSLESMRQLSGQRSKRLMPDTASYITRSLMKDELPSENSEKK